MTEPVGESPAASRVPAVGRSTTEPVGERPAAARVPAVGRPTAEPVGERPAASRVPAVGRSTAEPVGERPAASRVPAVGRSTTEPVGESPAASRVPADDGVERREFLALCGQGALLAAGAGLLGHAPAAAQEPARAAGPAVYAAKDYGRLKGLKGITDVQVQVHLELYAGYVKRTNALLARLWETRATPAAAWQELRRRVGWEWDGMRLHELYFDGLTKDAAPLDEASPFAQAVTASHGGVAAWTQDLVETARLPGVGWVITYRDPAGGRLLNTWVESHEEGHLAGAEPLLVLDVWEHAWTAYRKPTERAAYLQDWLGNVDWSVVARRLESARARR